MIKELKKEKSQLAYHIFMVSSENQQLWKKLTQFILAQKSLGNQLTKISDNTKQQPSPEIPIALTYSFKEIPGFFKSNESDKCITLDKEGKSSKYN